MEPIKVAMIGLDTSHCVELPRRMHSPDLPANEKIDGMKIVAVNRFETPFQARKGSTSARPSSKSGASRSPRISMKPSLTATPS